MKKSYTKLRMALSLNIIGNIRIMSVHNTKNYNKSIWILRNKLSGDET